MQNGAGIANGRVKVVDLHTASVTRFYLVGREDAERTGTVKPKRIFEPQVPNRRGFSPVVGDCDLFALFNVSVRMNGFVLRYLVSIIMCVRKAAVADEADGGRDAPHMRARTAWQGVGFDNAAERVLPREIVM